MAVWFHSSRHVVAQTGQTIVPNSSQSTHQGLRKATSNEGCTWLTNLLIVCSFVALHLLSQRKYERTYPERNEGPACGKQRQQVGLLSFETGRSWQDGFVLGRRISLRDNRHYHPGK